MLSEPSHHTASALKSREKTMRYLDAPKILSTLLYVCKYLISSYMKVDTVLYKTFITTVSQRGPWKFFQPSFGSPRGRLVDISLTPSILPCTPSSLTLYCLYLYLSEITPSAPRGRTTKLKLDVDRKKKA